MAYGYYPAGFSPLQYYPQYQPQQNNGLIWVANEDEANNYLVMPNAAVALWHKTEKIIYIKSADATGMMSMKKLKYDFIDEQPSANGEYVSKADFDALAEQVKKILQGDKQ